jgi:methylglutaconyl-CoA hydratase
MADVLLEETIDGVLRLTMNRPEAHNALNRELASALATRIEAAGSADGIRTIVLTGAGERTFCSGADLKEAGGRMFDRDEGANPIAGVMRATQACPKLVIARINGSVLAGGLGLVAACDLAYAADHAKFGLPEVKVGVFPLMVSVLLMRQMPARRLAELAFLGEPFGAAEAERYSIVNRVVPAADLDTVIASVTDRIRLNAPGATAFGKKALGELSALGIKDGLARAEAMIAELGAGAEAREGRSAFADKRPPNWAR